MPFINPGERGCKVAAECLVISPGSDPMCLPGAYNRSMLRNVLVPAVILAAVAAGSGAAAAQTPLPFPKPGTPQKPAQPPTVDRANPPQPADAQPRASATPSEATLGMPVYPTAEFIASYDAGRGQRYYLFGTNATFVEIVAYYRAILKQRGDLVYEEPPVHMFDVGRFRQDTMAFPPGITVKDYTWAGSSGYLVPAAGTQGQRYKTIIQVVPPPAGSQGR